MNNQRTSTILLWLGGFLLLTGLGWFYIDLRWNIFSILSSAAGAVVLVLVFWDLRRKLPAAPRSLGRGVGVFFYVLLLIAALAFVNYKTFRFDIRWDITSARQHTLSAGTKALLAGLKKDVAFTAFYVGLPPKYLEDILNEYQRRSGGKVTATIVDPLVDLGYAAQFGSTINGQESKLIVQSGSTRRDVDFTDQPLTEESVNNALLRVTRPERHAYFLSGHNEYAIGSDDPDGFSKFRKLLADNNILGRDLLLKTTGKVPDDCDVLVISGPKNPLGEKEEKLVKDYLRRGGDALILVENVIVTTPDKPLTDEQKTRNPSLNGILSDWGLKVADDIVVDLTSHASGDVGSPATRNYMAQKTLTQGLDYTFYVRPRSMAVLADRRKTLNLMPLVLTGVDSDSWGETNRMLQVKYDEGVDRKGPLPIAFVVAEPKGKDKVADTHLAVFTDADFLSNAFIDSYSNGQLGANIMNWLTEMDYQAMNITRDVTVHRLDLTSQQKRRVLVVLIAMPFLIGLAGINVWLRWHE